MISPSMGTIEPAMTVSTGDTDPASAALPAAGARVRAVLRRYQKSIRPDQAVTVGQMTDSHRVLVDRADRLGNIDQLAALATLGWTGPVSFEAFSPRVHASVTPSADLSASIAFIRDGLARMAA